MWNDEILYANRAFKNLYGFDAIGKNSWQVTTACHPERGDFQADPRRLGLDDVPRELFDGEIRHRLSGRWLHLRDRAIRWVDGRIVRMEIAADITDRKHMEEAALQHQERLEQTSRLITLGEMASSLAHELNQPLPPRQLPGSVNRIKSAIPAGRHPRRHGEGQHPAERAGKIIRRTRIREEERAGAARWCRRDEELSARRHRGAQGGRGHPRIFRRTAGVRRPHMIEQVVLNREERHRVHAAGACRRARTKLTARLTTSRADRGQHRPTNN
jgi:PAS domain S-box-containing protein